MSVIPSDADTMTAGVYEYTLRTKARIRLPLPATPLLCHRFKHKEGPPSRAALPLSGRGPVA